VRGGVFVCGGYMYNFALTQYRKQWREKGLRGFIYTQRQHFYYFWATLRSRETPPRQLCAKFSFHTRCVLMIPLAFPF